MKHAKLCYLCKKVCVCSKPSHTPFYKKFQKDKKFCVFGDSKFTEAARNITTTGRLMMRKKRMKFEKLLIKSVDDSLKDTFGETATEIIYKHLERNHSLKQEEIPKKLEVFIEGLEKFLNSGAMVVEGLVLEKLCSNLGLEHPSEKRLSFVDYVTKLRRTSDSVCV